MFLETCRRATVRAATLDQRGLHPGPESWAGQIHKEIETIQSSLSPRRGKRREERSRQRVRCGGSKRRVCIDVSRAMRRGRRERDWPALMRNNSGQESESCTQRARGMAFAKPSSFRRRKEGRKEKPRDGNRLVGKRHAHVVLTIYPTANLPKGKNVRIDDFTMSGERLPNPNAAVASVYGDGAVPSCCQASQSG